MSTQKVPMCAGKTPVSHKKRAFCRYTRRRFQLTFRALHGNHIVMVTPAVYPRLFSHHFDIQSTARKSHCHGYTPAVYPRLLLSTSTFRALHGHLAALRESGWTFTHACLRLHHFDILSTAQTQTNQFDTYM